MIQFHVPGNPLPKQSFKKSKKGGYTPKRIKEWEETVAWTAKAAMGQQELLQGKLQQELLQGKLKCDLVFVRDNRRRVDVNNLSKPVTDAMNGVVYDDDSQIVDQWTRKFYSKENPGLTVKVYPVDENIGGSENG
jgi:Holliday junction resolvase RusA-like endonuclease